MKFLQGHVSPETAHMHDHPYGRRNRCIQRIWLQTATKGQKEGQTCVCYQTSQKHVYDGGELPEVMPAGGADRNANWNKVKKSTYSDGITVLYLDEEGHVHAFCLRVIDSPERFAEFDKIVGDQLSEFDRTHREMMEKMNRKHYPENWTEYDKDHRARLEYLRGEIEAERISYDEIHELQSLASHIEAGDVLLLEWAGVPE